MAAALSPRKPAPRLRSTDPDHPRRAQSPMQARALINGWTLKAGPVTLGRLSRSVVRITRQETLDTPHTDMA
jgi:hypothetical protein